MSFDPYHIWLGIPPDEQPPNHYRLLGLRDFEADPEVIENAADSRMSHVRTFQSGRYAHQSQKLLNELAGARVILLSPAKREAYDKELRARQQPKPDPPKLEPLAAPASADVLQPVQEAAYGIQPLEGWAHSTSPALQSPSTFATPARRRRRPMWLLAGLIGVAALLVSVLAFVLANLANNERLAGNLAASDVGAEPANKSGNQRPPADIPFVDSDDPSEGLNPELTESGTVPANTIQGAKSEDDTQTDASDPETADIEPLPPFDPRTKDGSLLYTFTSEAEFADFEFEGDHQLLPGGGLELPGGRPKSVAKTKRSFTYPIQIDYEVYALADGLCDIHPGFGPLYFYMAYEYNKRTAVQIADTRTRIPHVNIKAGHVYQISISLDESRTLRISVDGVPNFYAKITKDIPLEGPVILNGGLGHVVYKRLTIRKEPEPVAMQETTSPTTSVAPPAVQTVYDFKNRDTARDFRFDGQYVLQFGELHIYDDNQPVSNAFSRKEFGYPLEVRYQLHCFPARTAHIALGYGPIRFLWGFDKNTTTAVKIGDAHINLPHKPVVPAQTYRISLSIDAERTLRIRIDDELLFEDRISPDVDLAGPIVLGAGDSGWVAYDGAIVLPFDER